MPPTLSLPQFSGRQIEATSGFRPRLAYADILRDELPNFYAARQAGQQNRALDLSEEQMDQQNRMLDIQARSLASQEEAQASAQGQQTIGSGIQAVGTLGQGGYALAKEFGLIGTKTPTGLSATATPAPSLAVGASTGTAVLPGAAIEQAGSFAAADAVGTAAATGTQAVAPTGFASLGTLGGAAAGASVAGLGLGVGSLVGKPVKKLVGGGFKGKVASHAAGAAAGALVGAGAGLIGGPFAPISVPVGALLGAIGGGLGASFCPMHSAAYGNDSVEVAIVRKWRDTRLSLEQQRAYYTAYAPIATKMDADVAYRMQVRHVLIDPLIRYGAHKMGIHYKPMQAQDRQVAEAFLERLRVLGKGMGAITRANGEII